MLRKLRNKFLFFSTLEFYLSRVMGRFYFRDCWAEGIKVLSLVKMDIFLQLCVYFCIFVWLQKVSTGLHYPLHILLVYTFLDFCILNIYSMK